MSKTSTGGDGFDLGGIHHAACRCKNSKVTVELYPACVEQKYDFAFTEHAAPSTGEHSAPAILK